MPAVALTSEIQSALAAQAVVAVGVSGGKDSDACAIAVSRHLDAIGHIGPRVLIHSDLGRIEWRESLPHCEQLASALGWELIVVRRNAGDMLDRWETRWVNNVERYANLSCVKLILPWSTSALRFCSSEMKVDQITSALKKRFPGLAIINAAGIRREESPARAAMPVSSAMAKLQRKNAIGLAWNPIIEWKLDDVWNAIASAGIHPHEAYTRYGARRVSCVYCIMSTEADLMAAAACEDNHEVYRLLVDLEARSSFAFQGNRWLGDVAPHLLHPVLRDRLLQAKVAAVLRQAAEAHLPKHLLYTAGWPSSVPNLAEARLIARVRRDVRDVVGIDAHFLTGEDVRARYAELLAQRKAA
jgi:3'-phosphoadenosine 5'-phosphosulfate sulfotransferase (PAPS reductase)/FAD synthetase